MKLHFSNYFSSFTTFIKIPVWDLNQRALCHSFYLLYDLEFSHKKIRNYNNYQSLIAFIFQSDIQAPLNRQIIKSSETIMYMVKLMNNFFDYFMGGASAALSGALTGNGVDQTDDMPRSGSGSGLNIAGFDIMQGLEFVRTLYNLSK